MPRLSRGTFQLHYEDSGGGGEPVVFIHGTWGDHQQWEAAASRMADTYRVLSYDRRGHGASRLSGEQMGLSDQVADLSELISIVARGPVHVVSQDVGATIALHLAVQRPDQVRGVNLHEPPLVGLLEGDPAMGGLYHSFREMETTIANRILARDPAGAAQSHMDATSTEAGAWAQLTESSQRAFIASAPTSGRELQDLALKYLELSPFATYREPIVLTSGSRSAPVFGAINDHLVAGFYSPLRYSYEGASHFPHVSHAENFARVAVEFCRFASQRSAR
jgi:pimeloyl-ACP methyl ester carboxylesterase